MFFKCNRHLKVAAVKFQYVVAFSLLVIVTSIVLKQNVATQPVVNLEGTIVFTGYRGFLPTTNEVDLLLAQSSCDELFA